MLLQQLQRLLITLIPIHMIQQVKLRAQILQLLLIIQELKIRHHLQKIQVAKWTVAKNPLELQLAVDHLMRLKLELGKQKRRLNSKRALLKQLKNHNKQMNNLKKKVNKKKLKNKKQKKMKNPPQKKELRRRVRMMMEMEKNLKKK